MNLNRVKLIGIDTNIFVYQFSQHKEFFPATKKLFQLLAQSRLKGVTSIISLTELLSYPVSPKDLAKAEEAFFSAPNLAILNVDRNIASLAAKIRRDYGYRSPDAIQLATALSVKADLFVTNDQRLKSFKEIKIRLISES